MTRCIEDARRAIHRLQVALAEASGPGHALPTPQIAHLDRVDQVRGAVLALIPEGATVLVVSRGEDALIDLEGRRGQHFPQTPAGEYAGHHPATSEEAVDQLEALRNAGAQYLVVPSESEWWLEHYGAFARHLNDHFRAPTRAPHCLVFALDPKETPIHVG